jgi:hypothetical protein
MIFLLDVAVCCAQQTGMRIMVVEALLVAIYLPEEKRTFICTFNLPCCLRPPCHLGLTQLDLQLPLYS